MASGHGWTARRRTHWSSRQASSTSKNRQPEHRVQTPPYEAMGFLVQTPLGRAAASCPGGSHDRPPSRSLSQPPATSADWTSLARAVPCHWPARRIGRQWSTGSAGLMPLAGLPVPRGRTGCPGGYQAACAPRAAGLCAPSTAGRPAGGGAGARAGQSPSADPRRHRRAPRRTGGTAVPAGGAPKIPPAWHLRVTPARGAGS
jgi:hypothetical protein